MCQHWGRFVCFELSKQSQLFLVCSNCKLCCGSLTDRKLKTTLILSTMFFFYVFVCKFIFGIEFLKSKFAIDWEFFSHIFVKNTLFFLLRFENHCRCFDSICQEDDRRHDFDHLCTGCICPHWTAAVHGKSAPQMHPLAHSQQHHLWRLQLQHGQWHHPQRYRHIRFQSLHKQWRWSQVKVIKYFQLLLMALHSTAVIILITL